MSYYGKENPTEVNIVCSCFVILSADELYYPKLWESFNVHYWILYAIANHVYIQPNVALYRVDKTGRYSSIVYGNFNWIIWWYQFLLLLKGHNFSMAWIQLLPQMQKTMYDLLMLNVRIVVLIAKIQLVY